MTNYVKSTNFAEKDGLSPGDANKKVKGQEFETEFVAIATAIESKADLVSPIFSGTPVAPTAAASTDTTQIATTAFVQAAIAQDDVIDTDQIVDEAITTAKLADTAVTADTYGSATEVPEITVNAKGQVTALSTNSIVFPSLSMTSISQDVNIGDSYNIASNTFVISGHAFVGMGSNDGGRLDIEIYTDVNGTGTKLDTVKAFGGNELNGNDGGSGMSVSGTWTVLLPATARSIKFVKGTGSRNPDPITIESYMTYTDYHS